MLCVVCTSLSGVLCYVVVCVAVRDRPAGGSWIVSSFAADIRELLGEMKLNGFVYASTWVYVCVYELGPPYSEPFANNLTRSA